MGMEMERKESKDRDRVESVRRMLRKQAPLTLKQEKYCNDACVERFLRARGDSVKKAAKHLRAVLSWRETIGTDHLIAEEFAAELAEGVAYMAGHDDDARPVVVFRIKQNYPKFHSQRSFLRLLVFTLEVAVSSMSRFVDQFVLLFDASVFRSASAFLNLLMGALKIVADYYPGRLHRAFVVDPPSLFSVLWKGVRPFVELSAATAAVCSLDFEDSLEDGAFAAYPRTVSLRFDHGAGASAAKPMGSSSSRFSFTVSHLNSLKPWYLSTAASADASRSVVPAASPSLVGASPLSARSFSFASPATRSSNPTPSPCPPLKQKPQQPKPGPARQQQQFPRTPRPSFLQSPAAALFSFGREGQPSRGEREREAFRPYLRYFRRPYDEALYRAKMRPPLGGLASIVWPHVRQHKPQQTQAQPRRNPAYIHPQQRF